MEKDGQKLQMGIKYLLHGNSLNFMDKDLSNFKMKKLKLIGWKANSFTKKINEYFKAQLLLGKPNY
jgi:hypothetical protein